MAIGSFIIAPLSDLFGRRKFFLGGIIKMVFIYWVLFNSKNYNDLRHCLFFYGMCLAIILISGLIYMKELINQREATKIILFTFLSQIIFNIAILVYFKYYYVGW
jgi:MFS family permease